MKIQTLVTAAVLCAATSARADWPRLSASLGYTSEVFTARSWDLVDADDHLPMFRLGAAATLEVARGSVDLEAAYLSGATEQTAHAAVPANLWLRGVELGATWRYPLYKHLHPYVHLGAGWDWATLTLLNTSQLTQTVSNLSGRGLLGVQVPVEILARDRHAPTILLDLGVGYVVRPGYAFTSMGPQPVAKPGPDPIANATVNVGTMPLSGITWRLLLTFRM